MISYASIEEITKNFAECEVEDIPIQQSKTSDFASKPTTMISIPLEMFSESFGQINEGDIIIVRRYNEEVSAVYCKDDEEKNRRIDILKRMIK